MSFVSRPRTNARVTTAQRAVLGAWGSSMMFCSTFGDVALPAAPSSSSIDTLQRQINRYTMAGGAPIQLRIGSEPLPVTGMMDAQTATRALWIMQMRAGYASIQWEDAASKQLVTEAMKAWSSPAPFVLANLPRVTQVVKLFGDKMGVPPAKGLPIGLTPTVIAGAITIGALALMWRKR